MTQREFHFERASVEAHIARVGLSPAERKLLIGLVRFFFSCRDTGDGRGIRCEDGRVLVEPSKEDLAYLLGCSVPTIKRLLRETRDTAAYILIEQATHRTHCYTIDFPGLYAAPTIAPADPPRSTPKQGDHGGGSRSPRRGITPPHLGDHDPGSGGSKGGIMTRGHRGGKGGLHQIPSGMNEMNSMESMEHGILEKSPERRSAFWWGRELGEADFRDPPRMQELYERVRDHGFVGPGEQDRIAWFALLVHYGRRKKLRNRSAVLTALVRRGGKDGLGRPWRVVPTAGDEDTARRKLRDLDHPRAVPDATSEAIAAEFGVVPDEDGFFSLPMPPEDAPEPESDLEPEFVSQIPAAELERLRQACEARKQAAISPSR